jgi:hypothetical protein
MPPVLRARMDNGGVVRRSCPLPAVDENRSTVTMTNQAAHLNVLISGRFAGAYEQLLPEFQRMSGTKIIQRRREVGNRASDFGS